MKRPLLAAMIASVGLSAAHAEGEIAMAIAGPLTGPYATFGLQMKAGAEMAVADLNAAGGVNGRKLRLAVEDDGCDATRAVAVAGRLAALGVRMVAGHFCARPSIAAAKAYAAEGIVQISPGTSSPRLTDERAGPSVFRVAGRDDRQGNVAGAYLARTFAGKRVAILHDRTADRQALAEATLAAMAKAGLTAALYQPYPAGEKDYSGVVAKLKAAGIEAVFASAYPSEAALIVREMRAQGLEAVLMAGETLSTPEYWQTAGPAAEGTLVTAWPDPRRGVAATQVVARLKAAGVDPQPTVLATYAAIEVWAQAARAAKTDDTVAVVAKLNALRFETVIGTFTFDAKGDSTLPPFAIYAWRGGRLEAVE